MTHVIRENTEITGNLLVDGYLSVTTASGSSVFGNLAYLDATSDITFLVETSGDDVNGDGYETPFATPQRAMDEIPDGATGVFIIQCGIGTFPAPVFRRKPGPSADGLKVFVIGNRSAPDITLSSPTFTLVSGKTATFEANVGAFGATITDGTHWVETLSGSRIGGRPALASTSPNLQTVSNADYGSIAQAVHPFTTIFDTNRITGCLDPNIETDRAAVEVAYVGIDFDTPGATRFLNAAAEGCVFRSITYMSRTIGFTSSTWEARCETYSWGESDRCAFGGLFQDRLQIRTGNIQMAGAVCRGSSRQIQVSFEDNEFAKAFSFAGIDFEGSGTCIQLWDQCAFFNDGDISIANDPPTFLDGRSNSIYRTVNAGSDDVTGSTSGVCILLIDGAQAINVSSHTGTLTNSSTPGEEIQIGSGAPIDALGDLPITDATSQCRAT